MLIATITNAATSQGHEIDYSTRALDILIKVTEPDNYANVAAFLAAIDDIKIEVNKQTRGGTEKILQRGIVLDYMEIAQGNGGLLEVNASALGAPYIRGRVELSDLGAIPLGENEKLVVDFHDVVPAGDGDETLEIKVWAVDHELTTGVHNVYDRIHFNGGSPKEILVSNAKLIAIPADECQDVELYYANGRRCQFTKEELLTLQTDWLEVRNVVRTSTASLINELNRTILVNVSTAQVAKITTVNDAKVLLMKYQNL